MKIAATRHAVGEDPREERPISIEPPLGLEKGEEQQARRAEQCELTSSMRRRAPHAARDGRRGCECVDGAVQRAVKPPRERLASQEIKPSRVRSGRVGTDRRGQRGEGLGVAVDNRIRIDDQCSNARRLALARPGREDELSRGVGSVRRVRSSVRADVLRACAHSRDAEPREVWGATRQARGDARHDIVQHWRRSVRCNVEQQRP